MFATRGNFAGNKDGSTFVLVENRGARAQVNESELGRAADRARGSLKAGGFSRLGEMYSQLTPGGLGRGREGEPLSVAPEESTRSRPLISTRIGIKKKKVRTRNVTTATNINEIRVGPEERGPG